MSVRLWVIGGGKMGGALVAGLLSSAWAEPSEIAVVEPVDGQRAFLTKQHQGLVVVPAPTAQVAEAEGVILAVKPDHAEGACRVLGPLGVTRVLSIVAGLSAERLQAALGEGPVVMRAMPNTPALIGAGISALSGGSRAHAADLDWAEQILESVGTVVRLPERQLDAVTALSGSGPAYLFLVAESLIEAGVLAGLSRDVSRLLVIEMLYGSSRMLKESGEEPEMLRAAVTSPGGTTAAALRTLESRAVRSAFLEAVASATERARQLGR